MKYVMLRTRGSWQEEGTDDERAAVFGQLMQWFTKLRDRSRTTRTRHAHRLTRSERRCSTGLRLSPSGTAPRPWPR